MSSVYENKPWLNTYPAWMSPSLSLPSQSVLDEFESACQRRPDAPCVHYFDTTYSYGEIRRKAAALAGAFERLGVARQDRIIMVMQNIPQVFITCLAAWMRNGVVVPLNPMFKAKDLELYLKDSQARLVVCQDDLYEENIKPAVQCVENVRVITTSPLDLLGTSGEIPAQLKKSRKLTFSETTDFMDSIRSDSRDASAGTKPGPRDLAYLVYTSGTTGPPKGAMISHGNVTHNARVYETACRLDQADVVLGVAPLFHVTGIVAHLAIAFHLGIPVVIFNRFDAGDVLRLIDKYKTTFTVAAITVYIALLNDPRLKDYDVSGFKKAYSGGAPVSPSTVKNFRDAAGLEVHNVYGLTESTSPATITPLGLMGPVDEESGALSVGLIVPGHEAWIVDVDDSSKEMPPGQEGELVLRGPGIVSGYWQKPEETANAIKDHRFHTGDIAKIDEQGWCYIVDRKKDLINASGFKVWPREVEDVLYKHPAVKEAAVVGVPDEYRGETVKAFVSVRDEYKGKVAPEDLVSFCKGQMAAYKYPRVVEIIDEVPKTATGKMLRRALKNA